MGKGSKKYKKYKKPKHAPFSRDQKQAREIGKRLFRYLDGKNGGRSDGQLTWDEFKPLCAKAGWPIEHAQKLWYQSDRDRSGSLSHFEFATFCARPDVLPYVSKVERELCGSQGAYKYGGFKQGLGYMAPGLGAAPSMGGFEQKVASPAGKPPGYRLYMDMQTKQVLQAGSVTWTVFAALLSKIGWQQQAAQALWHQTDTDKSGSLSAAEWNTFCTRPDVSPHILKLENAMFGPVMAAAPAPAYGHVAHAPVAAVAVAPAKRPGQRLWEDFVAKKVLQSDRLPYSVWQSLSAQTTLQPAQATAMFQAADMNKDGTVSVMEWDAMCSKPGAAAIILALEAKILGAAPATAAPAFAAPVAAVAAAPAKRPGQALYEDMKSKNALTSGRVPYAVWSSLAQQTQWTPSQATLMFQTADANKDGTLTIQEWDAMCSRADVAPGIVALEQRLKLV